jgi:hypothetical protein
MCDVKAPSNICRVLPLAINPLFILFYSRFFLIQQTEPVGLSFPISTFYGYSFSAACAETDIRKRFP